MGATIERRGVDDVVSGYNLYPDAMFSLWQGTALKFSHISDVKANGEDVLMQNLQAIEANGSNAIYTLCIHKEHDKDGYITKKTPVIGSFNFKLCDGVGNGMVQGMFPQYQGGNTMQKILERLDEMQKQLDEDSIQEDRHPAVAMAEQIAGVMERFPALQGFVANFISSLMGKPVQQQPHQISGLPEQPPVAQAVPGMKPDEKLSTALKILLQVDKEFPDNLLKLAGVAQKQPDTYAFLVNQLKSM